MCLSLDIKDFNFSWLQWFLGKMLIPLKEEILYDLLNH